MNTAFPIYPAYCFSQSPTFNRWVKLTAADFHSLRCEPGFEGQKIYFHLNHPIKHVSLVGCVVAIESPFAKYTVISIDDGSDAIVDAKVTHVLPDNEEVARNRPHAAAIYGPSRQVTAPLGENEDDTENMGPSKAEYGSADTSSRLKIVTMDTQTEALTITSGPGVHIVRLGEEVVDIGTVLKLKGTIHVWRDSFQLTLLRAYVVKTVDEEIRAWKEYTESWCKILMSPWYLSAAEIRSLQLAENQDARLRAERRRKVRERHEAREARRLRIEAKANEKIQKMSIDIDGNPLDRRQSYAKD